MSELIDTLRAIVRDEMARNRCAELGIVVQVHANGGDGNNHQVDVRLRSSGVELKRAPVTVQRYGISALPRVGDLVLVVFLRGELNAPMVIGCVYDAGVQPPEADEGEMVYVVPDEGREKHLHMELPSGTTLTFGGEKVTLVSGETQVEIENDGSVKIHSAKNVELSASGDISLQADGAIKFEAATNIEMKAKGVNIEASTEANVKASALNFAGVAQFSPS